MLVGLKARGFHVRGSAVAAAPAAILFLVALALPASAVASSPSVPSPDVATPIAHVPSAPAQAIVTSTIARVSASTPAAPQIAEATRIVTSVASQVTAPRPAPDPAPQANAAVVHPAAAQAAEPDPSPPPRRIASFHASPPVSPAGGDHSGPSSIPSSHVSSGSHGSPPSPPDSQIHASAPRSAGGSPPNGTRHRLPALPAARALEAMSVSASLPGLASPWQPAGNQLTAAPLGQALETLISRLELLAHDSSAAAASSEPPLRTTVRASLSGMLPSIGVSAQRTISASAASGYRGSGPTSPSSAPAPSGAAPDVLPLSAPATQPGAAGPRISTRADTQARTSEVRQPPAVHRAPPRTLTRPVVASLASQQAASPTEALAPEGGGASAGSGGIGSPGAAMALLALAGLCLLRAFLPGRLPLDPFPWRSALLSLRLERPG